MEKDQLKSHIEDFLHGQGLPLDRHFCCLNPAHDDTHPSMKYDPRRQAVHCFSCGADFDLFELLRIEYGVQSFSEQKELAQSLYVLGIRNGQKAKGSSRKKEPGKKSIPIGQQDIHADPKVAQYLAACAVRAEETEYFAKRGLSKKTVKAFGLGFDPNYSKGTGGSRWHAAIIPTAGGSYTARNVSPEADASQRIRKTGESAFLGSESLHGNDPVFVVEGEFDALSLYEVGAKAVSLGSCANVPRFLQALQSKAPSCPALLLALDDDEAGHKAQAQLLTGLQERGIKAFEVDILQSAADPNEALCQDREAFTSAVREALQTEARAKEEAKKAYLSNSSAAHLQKFLGQIAASVDTPALSTGFAGLNAQLDGGLYEGLYIVGAISSLGKTTLMLQIADQIASGGCDVLLFSLEMARSELMAKSISRHTLMHCLGSGRTSALAKSARGITTGQRYLEYTDEEQHVIATATQHYGSYAQHIFIHEGIGDIGAAQIRETIRVHIEITGKAPVVLIDYLQIMAPYSERATDKQNTDRAVLELKRISRDYKIPVLGISSFNRANYASKVTMEAFKESGAIEYSSDVLLGLQLRGAGEDHFDVNAAKRENPRQVELVVLKNRNGKSGGSVHFKYYPVFNCFVEE